MSNYTKCPSCSELKKYVDQQGELISQLMKMIAQTHEKLVVLETELHRLSSDVETEYPYSMSKPNSTPTCQGVK
ncbi:hypothetical protein [Tenuibacillus multivorans]|uniref:Uncharacterized protein n=1 Tax=Tenuibacillus multivorans TaxID=237069 RepID=A0A1H0DKS8_9BACI|nr:hypothetical protein [Tenuibacillus multivorans]GEL76508.1 hypothetical protein TMU01_07430 [Tenuibacillus multivorans]SDN70857.1 hypothetical protein SAMN05216498_2917 [Tenuibacillus multivorans]